MTKNNFEYYSNFREKIFSDQKKLITYLFNETEQKIVGLIEEKENLIYLYEYRGKFVGYEFLISFSKDSASYRLINVTDMNEEQNNNAGKETAITTVHFKPLQVPF
jgi:hypothetical protein